MILPINEARELWGDEVVDMSDAQVEELLALFEGLVDIIFDMYIGERRGHAAPPEGTKQKT